MAEALTHLPIQDILKNIYGKQEVFDKMIRRKPNDPEWFNGGIYHDDKDIGTPSFCLLLGTMFLLRQIFHCLIMQEITQKMLL